MFLLSIQCNTDSAPSCVPVRGFRKSPIQGARKTIFMGRIGACGHELEVTRIKEADSGDCSEQDDKRFRYDLGRPRAAAHRWGKVARIRTEINRIPRLAFSNQGKIGSAPRCLVGKRASQNEQNCTFFGF
jgi:hypothetical protein